MSNDARTGAHRKLAHELAVAGTILLRNMFAPEDAKADEDFEEEMKEDIGGECAKYGRIEHVKVDKVRCCPRRTHSSRQASILYTVL